MIHIIKTIKVNATVSALHVTNDEIQILDSSYLINAYSTEDFSILYKHLLSKKQDNRHTYDKSYALCGNLNIYLSIYNDNSGLLFTMKNNKLVAKDNLPFHENAVSFARFSNDSSILSIGDEDGKAFFYSLGIKKVLFSLSPRADAISCISFSKNDRYTAVASYDKTILIYDIESNLEISEASFSDVIEDCIFLQDSMNIAGITRDKRIFYYTPNSNETIYSEFEFDEWPSVIIEIGSKHLLIGTRGTNLYLIKTDTLELVKEIDSQNIGVKTLNLYNDKLHIGYIDGKIEIIDTMYLSKEFEANLSVNKFATATSLMEKNIFLLTNKKVSKYDTVWEQVLDMAKGHLIKDNIEAALKIVKPFFFDRKKELEYEFLNSNKKDFEYFMKLVKEEKDVMAFKFADEHEYLQNTKEYKAIDMKWNKVYQVCKQLFAKDDLESSQKAINTLKRYSIINSKKVQVDNLVTNYKHFIRAQKLVKARNFKLYFILAEKKPFLTQEALFDKVTQIGHQTYLKLLDLEQKEEFEKANSIAKYLLDFTAFKDKAAEHIECIKAKENLQNYIDADDADGVYNSINENKELENFKSFVNYHKIYNDTKYVALESAKDGKTEDVHCKFNKYLDINYLESSMSFVFKLSYLMEMENAAKEDMSSIHWIETVKRYTNIYDWDNEILSLVKKLDIEDILMSSNTKFEKSNSKKIEFHDSVLVYS